MSVRLKSVDQIFPTPLLRFEVANFARLNAELLVEISARRSAEPGVTISNRKGWHSATDLFDRAEPAQQRLASLLRDAAMEATRKVDPTVDPDRVRLLCDGWVNVNPRGAYNSPHDHPGSFWSGTYYVQVPDESGDAGAIEFVSPKRALPGGGVVGGELTKDKAMVRPKAGMLLLFPSSTLHWVHPNESDQERVTVAFNVRFQRKSGPVITARYTTKQED